MAVKPYKWIKLDAEGKSVATHVLALLGYGWTVKYPLRFWGGVLGLPLGVAALIGGMYSAAIGAPTMIPGFLFGALLIVLSFLGIAKGKGGTWYSGHGQRFRLVWEPGEGVTRVSVLDETEAHEVGAMTIAAPRPVEPPAKDDASRAKKDRKKPPAKRLRPWLYTELVPFLARTTAEVSGRDLTGMLSPRRVDLLRGLVLLGAVARRLDGRGVTNWRKQKHGVSGSAFLGILAFLTQFGGLMAGKLGGAIVGGMFVIVLPVIVVLILGRSLWCDLGPKQVLRIRDQIDGDEYTVALSGPGGDHTAVIHAGGVLAGGIEILDQERLADALDEAFDSASQLNSPA